MIHVKPGCEAQAVELLKSTPKSDGLQEVFCPMALGLRRECGEDVEVREPMFDGCVFAVAPSKWELRACMRRADGLDALCDDAPAFEALEESEEAFVNLLAEPGGRMVQLSDVVIEPNGRLTVARGPLRECEEEPFKLSESRRWTYMHTRLAGQPAVARLGLRIAVNSGVRL